MATVTQCDVCGKTMPQKHGKKLIAYDVNDVGSKSDKVFEVDVCIECYKKVLEVLKNDN